MIFTGKRMSNKEKIFTDPTYINSRKYDYNITRFMAKNERGVPDKIISSLLCMTVEDVQDLYEQAVEKLRNELVK